MFARASRQFCNIFDGGHQGPIFYGILVGASPKKVLNLGTLYLTSNNGITFFSRSVKVAYWHVISDSSDVPGRESVEVRDKTINVVEDFLKKCTLTNVPKNLPRFQFKLQSELSGMITNQLFEAQVHLDEFHATRILPKDVPDHIKKVLKVITKDHDRYYRFKHPFCQPWQLIRYTNLSQNPDGSFTPWG